MSTRPCVGLILLSSLYNLSSACCPSDLKEDWLKLNEISECKVKRLFLTA